MKTNNNGRGCYWAYMVRIGDSTFLRNSPLMNLFNLFIYCNNNNIQWDQ